MWRMEICLVNLFGYQPNFHTNCMHFSWLFYIAKQKYLVSINVSWWHLTTLEFFSAQKNKHIIVFNLFPNMSISCEFILMGWNKSLICIMPLRAFNTKATSFTNTKVAVATSDSFCKIWSHICVCLQGPVSQSCLAENTA